MPKLESQRALRKEYQKLTDGTLPLSNFLGQRETILDGMKVKRTHALGFASKVVDAAEQVAQSYVKDADVGEMVGWAIRGLYRRLGEPLPDDIKDRLANVKNMREAQLTILLADARERLGQREDLDKHKDIDIALRRMLSRLDPYTTYIDPATMIQFNRDMRRNYSGIGIQIRKDFERDLLLVVTPIKGSPAYRAGIKAGDFITHIIREVDSDGLPLARPEVLPTKGMALTDAVNKVLGKPDTKVKFIVERAGKPFNVEITRGMVELETVLGAHRRADDSWNFMIDPASQIGYVRLSSFAGNTARDLAQVVNSLETRGLKGLILDLRFNPGGLLRGAVTISDMFIDDGKIVSVRPRVGREEVHQGRHAGSYLDFPMVCLVNGGSASASEIVSACLQDHQRAVIIGERSYGKGSVQNIHPFDGGQLKITIASFWRPSGKNLNKASTAGKDDDEWGVTPDKLLKLTRKEREELSEHLHALEVIGQGEAKPKAEQHEFKDRQLEMAVDYLRGRLAATERRKKAG